MLKYITKRILISLILILGITFISFLIIHIAPGDPTTLFSMNPNVSPEALAHLRHSYGLDKPVLVQYILWLKSLIRGDMGISLIYHRNVLSVILERVPATLLLMSISLFIALIISIIIGLIAGLHTESLFDKFTAAISYFSVSMPGFWFAIILLYFFYYKWQILPAAGMTSMGIVFSSKNAEFIDKINHLILPATVLIIGDIGLLSRYIRSKVIDVASSEFVTAARARGIQEHKIVLKYVLRNTLLPLITILGMTLPALFSGAAITERIFSWPGMGWLTFEAIFKFDYPLIMGVLLISSILVVLGNLLADIFYSIADPRIRLE